MSLGGVTGEEVQCDRQDMRSLGSAAHFLWDLGQVTASLWASISSSKK